MLIERLYHRKKYLSSQGIIIKKIQIFYIRDKYKRADGTSTPIWVQTPDTKCIVVSRFNGKRYNLFIYGAAHLSHTARPVFGDK